MGLERLWVQPGMRVLGADGEYIGQVKQVRERDFVVSRQRHRDLHIPRDAVREALTGEQRLELNVSSKEVDQMGWENEPVTPAAGTTPSGQEAITEGRTVAELMVQTLDVVAPDQLVHTVQTRLGGEARLSLIVVEGERPVGIVRWREIMGLAGEDAERPVREFMVREFPHLTPSLTLAEALARLNEFGDRLSGIDYLPVVDEEGRLVGEVPAMALAHAEQRAVVVEEAADLGLRSGMTVVGAAGKKLGTVSELIRDTMTGELAGFVVAHGLLGRKHKRLTPEVIDRVEGDTVVLKIDAREFNLLADVEAQS
jgi:CBS domain-containing protein